MSNLNKLPAVQGFGGKLFSRSSFLEGRLPVAFGPNQSAYNCAVYYSLNNPDGGAPPTTFSSSDPAYSLPGDWMPAGSLLRPPQVVWFTAQAETGSTIESAILHEEAVTNAFSIGQAVQSRLATIRAGRTWMVILNEDGSTPENVNIQIDNATIQIGFLPIPMMQFPYYAGEFLAIVAGDVFTSIGPNDAFSTGAVASAHTELIGPIVESGTTLSVDPDGVTTIVNNTVGNASYLNSLHYAPIDYSMFAKYGAFWYINDTFTDNNSCSTTDSASDQDAVFFTANYVFCTAMAEQVKKDFGQYGFDYGALSDLTYDSLLQQIAEFFGFDPDTGLDVG